MSHQWVRILSREFVVGAVRWLGSTVLPPSVDCFWQMSRLPPGMEWKCSGEHPSPVTRRHSANAFSVRLSPARRIDGMRMQG